MLRGTKSCCTVGRMNLGDTCNIVLPRKNNDIFRLAFPESSINMIKYETSISSTTAIRGTICRGCSDSCELQGLQPDEIIKYRVNYA
jgi:hypothetical protein